MSLVHADHPDLARMAALDVVLNNADRKGGHVLDDGNGGLVGVDHGLTFNVDEKLRTVLWGWAGEPIDAEAIEVLDRVSRDLEAWLKSDDAGLWPEALAAAADGRGDRGDRPPGPAAGPARRATRGWARAGRPSRGRRSEPMVPAAAGRARSLGSRP